MRLAGTVTIERDEVVRGDITVIAGTLRVDGGIIGDVVVVAGAAHLGPEAEIRGEVTVVGGALNRAAGAQVLGRINEVTFDAPEINLSGITWPRVSIRPTYPFPLFGDLVPTLLRFLFLGILASVVLLVGRGPVDRIARRSVQEPLKAGLVGLLAQVLFVPLLVTGIVLLVISIIGIPLLLLVPFVLVAALVVLVVGFTGVAQCVGQWLAARLGREPESIYFTLWFGIAMLLAPTIAGHVLGLGGAFFGMFAILLFVAGLAIEFAAWTTGLGAAILNSFGSPLVPQAPGAGLPPPPEPPPSPVPDVPSTPSPGLRPEDSGAV